MGTSLISSLVQGQRKITQTNIYEKIIKHDLFFFQLFRRVFTFLSVNSFTVLNFRITQFESECIRESQARTHKLLKQLDKGTTSCKNTKAQNPAIQSSSHECN